MTIGRAGDPVTRGWLAALTGSERTFAEPIERHGDGQAAERLRRFTGPFILRRVKSDLPLPMRPAVMDVEPDVLLQQWPAPGPVLGGQTLASRLSAVYLRLGASG